MIPMVRRILAALLIMLASSFVVTATVHARENPLKPGIECSGYVHADGDADQSKGDSDKALPHHHGACHGMAVDLPAGGLFATSVTHTPLQPDPTPEASILSARVHPALRPPSA